MTYVGKTNRQPGCVFCNALSGSDDAESLVLLRGERCFIILNLYPYNSGHMMVVPNDHVASLTDLDGATRAEMMELATLATEASAAVLRCEGFNLGLNLGEIAGAGIAQHLHLHVVPRWTGDANFMPILGATMVLPELLPVTHARLRAELERVVAERVHCATAQAGGLVVLTERRAIVLRRALSGGVVLPKGHIEPGEIAAQAAVREVREETGVDATVVGWAGSNAFVDDAGQMHHVSYLLATGTTTDEFSEHASTDTMVVPIDEAAALLTFPDLREIVEDNLPVIRRLAGLDEQCVQE
jgi:ATP adenylyltransferase